MKKMENFHSRGLFVGAEPEVPFTQRIALQADKADPAARAAAAVSAAPKVKVLAEYDIDSDDDDDAYRTTKVEEAKTKEEVERRHNGDFEHVKPEEDTRPKIILRRRPKLAATVQKVAVKQAEETEQTPGPDKMMGQCMSFANWAKSQGSTGPDFVRIWKGTCMPAVMSGKAPPAYSNMCNALGSAVSKYALGPWNPSEVCNDVTAVFRESGVGATPL